MKTGMFYVAAEIKKPPSPRFRYLKYVNVWLFDNAIFINFFFLSDDFYRDPPVEKPGSLITA